VSTSCPKCGSTRLQVEIKQLADIEFEEDGSHQVQDTYGDLEFSSTSQAHCGECNWAGTLAECEKEDTP
jgi:hypothetical protein